MFVGLPGFEPGMRVYETPSITLYLQAHPFIVTKPSRPSSLLTVRNQNRHDPSYAPQESNKEP